MNEALLEAVQREPRIWIAAAIALLWTGVLIHSLFSRNRFPDEPRLRIQEIRVIVSSVVLLIACVVMAEVEFSASTASAIAAAGRKGSGSCIAVEIGMKSKDVTRLMGKPDRELNIEAVRGPAATLWIYERSRCAVHVVDGVVEAVE